MDLVRALEPLELWVALAPLEKLMEHRSPQVRGAVANVLGAIPVQADIHCAAQGLGGPGGGCAGRGVPFAGAIAFSACL